jgi:hypothetical protein
MVGTNSKTSTTSNKKADSFSFASKTPIPPNVGTRANIPNDVLKIAHLQRERVVVWAALDKKFQQTIGDVTCGATFQAFMIPCLWPFLLFLWPCLLADKIAMENAILHTYWVLTTTEIKVIVKQHDGLCGTNGEKVKTIPLDSITDCGVSAGDTYCGGGCVGLPSIYVDTASSGHGTESDASYHEAVGLGLSGYDWLVSEIIARRDTLKGHNIHHLLSSSPAPGAMNTGMDRGEESNEAETIESRLKTLENLRNADVLTETEYNTIRREILSSI